MVEVEAAGSMSVVVGAAAEVASMTMVAVVEAAAAEMTVVVATVMATELKAEEVDLVAANARTAKVNAMLKT